MKVRFKEESLIELIDTNKNSKITTKKFPTTTWYKVDRIRFNSNNYDVYFSDGKVAHKISNKILEIEK